MVPSLGIRNNYPTLKCFMARTKYPLLLDRSFYQTKQIGTEIKTDLTSLTINILLNTFDSIIRLASTYFIYLCYWESCLAGSALSSPGFPAVFPGFDCSASTRRGWQRRGRRRHGVGLALALAVGEKVGGSACYRKSYVKIHNYIFFSFLKKYRFGNSELESV